MSPARRNRLIASAILPVIAAVVIWPRTDEPAYQGKRLSTWLAEYSKGSLESSVEQREQAARAIREMGPDALPLLLGWLKYETPAWRNNLRKAAANWEVPFKDDLLRSRKSERVDEAAWAFKCLGSVANSAIPELARLLQSTNEHTAFVAGVALGFTGSASIPTLLNEFTNGPLRGSPQWTAVVIAWLQLGTNARPALPVLLQLLKGEDKAMAANAALLLRLAPVDPDVVVPALSASVQSENTQLRRRSVEALASFGSKAHPAILGLVVSALGDPALSVREAATNALHDIAPELLNVR